MTQPNVESQGALVGGCRPPARLLAAAFLAIFAGACASSQSPRPDAAAPGAAAAAPDTSAAAWVERTLASLTLREKVGQMVMPWVGGNYVATDSPEFEALLRWVERDGVGGLVMSVGLPHSYAAKLNELQRRASVPLLVTSDMENGPGMRMAGIHSFPHLLPQGGGTSFPPLMALGAADSEELAYGLGRVLGREARAVGVHMTFGPVLDVNSNPLNPIINTRSFGGDPERVAVLGRAYIRGAADAGLMTTAKHFPGHGDTSVDSHIDLPTIPASRARMDSVELYPFRQAVEGGVDAIMTAHIAVVGIEGENAPPATLSPYFMTGVLRDEMGFQGLLFTDALDMGAVAKRYPDGAAAVLAVESGADVLLMPRDVRGTIDRVVAAVESGRLPEARIDQSVRRLLEAKARSGLHRSRTVELDAVDERVGVRAHTELAARIAERSLTLVRDSAGSVPLRSADRLLVITYAEARDPIAGRAFTQALQAPGRSVRAVRVDSRTTWEELGELLDRADSVDAVIVSAFVAPLEAAGTIETGGGFSAFVQELARRQAPLVVVSFGSPYLLSAFPNVPAYLLAWGGQDVSQRAAARALLGEIPITGKLPVDLPPHHRSGEGLERAAGDDVPPQLARYELIPWPRKITPLEGGFTPGAGTRITMAGGTDGSIRPVARALAGYVEAAYGVQPVLVPADASASASTAGDIGLVLDPSAATEGDEGYMLRVHSGGVEIRARAAPGLFYGVQTLRQLMAVPGAAVASRIPAVGIEDAPRFAYRGLHLDVARHFFPVSFVKRYIDLLATYKLNRFHWHLTEDQGWRIQIERYPRLTEVGAFRDETRVGHARSQSETYDGTRYGGFYTQDEIREVVAYAAERHVTIIPEIEMPGHSLAALASYPELACTEGPFEVATTWGIFEDIYCPKEETFEFLQNVLLEVMDLFPGEYIHIGGDEAPKARWRESPIAQGIIEREGLADEHELQSWFVRRIEAFLNSHGRKLIGWDEIVEGGLSPTATVMYWRDSRGAGTGVQTEDDPMRVAVRQGNDLVMTPNNTLYLDHYQAGPEGEPLAIGGMTTLEDVYAYDPVPSDFTPAEARSVLGAQANVWTEYMKTPEHVEYMVFPRMLALAEVVWTPAEERRWSWFRGRVPAHLRRLDALGVRYRPLDGAGDAELDGR
jgi:hexosaminidase